MRKLVLTEFISLDGVIEAPMWTMEYWNDAIAAVKGRETADSELFLLGRKTYEGFIQAWPQRSGPDADVMNAMPKVVATTTLDTPTWNARFIQDVPGEVARLKAEDGGDILVHGSADLAQTLMQHNLIDEYHLITYPVIVGSGQRLFVDGGPTPRLKLVRSENLGPEVVLLVYAPADA